MGIDVTGAGLTRRRMIAVTAAAAGFALLPPFAPARADGEGALASWTGVALGAVATLRIHHPDRALADRLVAAAVAEMRRLEAVFSLYRDDSSLAELNRTGVLVAPPPELVALLEACGRFATLTGGAFDPTVQPLWQCHADHVSAHGRDAGPPPAAAVQDALARVGFDKLRLGRDRIVFARRGMALTLNGIAQGFVTDRVVMLLRDAGLAHALVDMGEIRALGDQPGRGPWPVTIEGPDETTAGRIGLVDRAVATSAASGFRFDRPGRRNHLFDPRTGGCAAAGRRVTVVADDATTADALSTAFGVMDDGAIARVLVETPGVERIA